MLFEGLFKGVAMLLVGAALSWFLADAFQEHAAEPTVGHTASADRAIHAPSLAHAPAKRADTQWMF